MKNTAQLYGAIVWIFAALVMFTYGLVGILGGTLPGVEQLVAFISTADGKYIYLAAFLAILIEGIYFVGSFFPGSTMVAVLAILSQAGGTSTFLTVIGLIFLGWCVAGAINIGLALIYKRAAKPITTTDYEVVDRPWTTWFPAFRANYEVAQVTEGGDPWRVFYSSVRVKFFASTAAMLGTLAIPYVIDIKEVSNEEGFTSLSVVALITLTVGIIKVRQYFKTPVEDAN